MFLKRTVYVRKSRAIEIPDSQVFIKQSHTGSSFMIFLDADFSLQLLLTGHGINL